MTYPNAIKTMQTIEELVSIPSPSGNTSSIIHYIKNWLKNAGVESVKTHKGNLIVTIEGLDTKRHRVLTAHVDALGAMVKEIKGDGRLRLSKIGGFNWNAVEGETCVVETADGKTVTGTILMHQTAVHVYKDAGSAARDDQNIEVRLDEVVHSRQDTESLGISVGDFVSFDPRVQITPSGFIKSRHLDDKASVGMLMRAIEQVKSSGIKLPHTTHFIIAVNEEIGFGGNSSIPAETVEYIAVDMGALGDGQTSDEFTVSICAKDSGGPYHLGLRKHLVNLAKENGIAYKVDLYPYYSSDATAAIRAGYEVKHGLIGAGIDASHAYERTHKDSIFHTESLIYHYLQSGMTEE